MIGLLSQDNLIKLSRNNNNNNVYNDLEVQMLKNLKEKKKRLKFMILLIHKRNKFI